MKKLFCTCIQLCFLSEEAIFVDDLPVNKQPFFPWNRWKVKTNQAITNNGSQFRTTFQPEFIFITKQFMYQLASRLSTLEVPSLSVTTPMECSPYPSCSSECGYCFTQKLTAGSMIAISTWVLFPLSAFITLRQFIFPTHFTVASESPIAEQRSTRILSTERLIVTTVHFEANFVWSTGLGSIMESNWPRFGSFPLLR